MAFQDLPRAMTVAEFQRKKFKTVKISPKFSASLGDKVQLSNSWIVYGASGHGKTTFCMQLAAELSKHGVVAYNTLEEGARLTFQEALSRQDFSTAVQKKIHILSEPIDVLDQRLRRKRRPIAVIVDSIQFSNLTQARFKKLELDHPNILFIWISHTDGGKPKGSLAKWVEYKSDIKIKVEGFRALPVSRYGGNMPYEIDKIRAAQYFADSL